MPLSMCNTVLCMVLVIFTVAANVIPNGDPSVISPAPNAVENNIANNNVRKNESDIMQFQNRTESELGSNCQFDETEGICTEMGYCPDYNVNPSSKNVKAENDPCLNILQTVVVCCSDPVYVRPTERLDVSESVTELVAVEEP
uniref:Clip domain-containing protein n=1 Tax=Anopheles minimus TaxID=112268 RepID=A0A182VY35_9DIPT